MEMHVVEPVKRLVLFAGSLVLLTSIACNVGTVVEATIRLSSMRTESREVDIETLPPQNNCDGSAQTNYEVRRSRSIKHEMHVSDEYEVNALGDVKILGTGVGLGGAVAKQVGRTYGVEETF